MRLPYRMIRVTGQSMTPTLLDGDIVLMRHGAPALAGAVVVARFRSRPDLLVVKRAFEPQDEGWLLVSDNVRAGADSASYGVADVLGVAKRVWRRPRSGPLGIGLLGRGLPALPPLEL